jgi:hypothetical protein
VLSERALLLKPARLGAGLGKAQRGPSAASDQAPPLACHPIHPPLPQFEEPAEGLQALRTTLDVRRALALGWARDAAQQRLTALAASNGKAAAAPAVNGGGRAARLAALEHPLAAPAELLERLRRELRLSRLQAGAVWRVLVYVTGGGTPAAVAGVQDMIRQQLVAQLAAAKDDAQGEAGAAFTCSRAAPSAEL